MTCYFTELTELMHFTQNMWTWSRKGTKDPQQTCTNFISFLKIVSIMSSVLSRHYTTNYTNQKGHL